MVIKMCFLFAVIALFPSLTVGQQRATETSKIKELELEHLALRRHQLKMRLDTAMRLSERGEYARAEKMFLPLLEDMDKIPSDLVYYFGKNSYHLGKYIQSVDWLNKYIELKGTVGKFSKNAVALLKTAEKERVKVKKNRRSTDLVVPYPSQQNHIDCGTTGKAVCPVCKGSTVIIKRGYTQNIYKTCPYCHHLGYVDCDEYNKIIHGKQHEK